MGTCPTVDAGHLHSPEMIGDHLHRFRFQHCVHVGLQVHIYHGDGRRSLGSCLLSSLDVSLQLGVNGIAYSNAIESFFSLLYAGVVFSRKMGMKPSDWKADHGCSGCGQLPRGLLWCRFIRAEFELNHALHLRMMNVERNKASSKSANGFIWAWMFDLPTGHLMTKVRPLLRITCGCFRT